MTPPITRSGAEAASSALRERLAALERPPLKAPASLVVFLAHGVRVGVDLELTREVLPLAATTPLPEAPPWVLGLVRVADRAVAVVDLAARIRGAGREPALDECILVVQIDDRELGLVVERVEGVTATGGAVVAAPPVDELAPWMLGVVELGGETVVVLEPAALLAGIPAETA